MGTWFEKSAADTLNQVDKVLIEQSGVTKTATMLKLQELFEFGLSEHVYAYLSSAANTVLSAADTWYLFNGTFVNSVIAGFTASAAGITYNGADGSLFETEWKTCGNTDDATVIQIGLIKNGTFNETTGALESGTFLNGSCGGAEAGAVQADQFVSPQSLWAGELNGDDLLTLVIKSSEAGITYTPISAAASIHKFI